MSTTISWVPLSEDERKQIGYDQLWGEESSQTNPIVSIPYGIKMPSHFEPIADKLLNFEVRSDDIWIVTYPKCGTTWTQEIVWHIMNDVDKEKGKMPLFTRSPFLEFQGLQKPDRHPLTKRGASEADSKLAMMIQKTVNESVDFAANMRSPRIIKSHMPFEFLPPNLLNTAKVIYVCRNPKDTCVSYFHHMTDVLDHVYQYQGTFEKFTQLFMGGMLEYGSYFDHLKSGWKHHNHPNMKFVWYEDLKQDTIKEVSDISKFLNHPMSDAKIEELVDHLKFSNMKGRAAEQTGGKNDKFTKFFRKGSVGDWKNYFKGDNLKLWDDWIQENIKESDIKFNFE